jgi:hypothetical protein
MSAPKVSVQLQAGAIDEKKKLRLLSEKGLIYTIV